MTSPSPPPSATTFPAAALAFPITTQSLGTITPSVTIGEIKTEPGLPSFQFQDSKKPYSKTWVSTIQPPKARLIYMHGFADHCNAYGILFPALASYGIQVHSYDQRGWGRTVKSPDEAGDIGDTGTIQRDLNDFIKSILTINSESTRGTPVFLGGHSMGGGNVLTFACSGPELTRSRLRGYVLESPFIAFPPGAQPSWAKVTFGKLAAAILPKRKLNNTLDPKSVSRDPDVQDEFLNDNLAFSSVTLEGLKSMLDRTSELADQRLMLKESVVGNGGVGLWISHGDGDKVTSYTASRKWFDAAEVKDKTFQPYDGWFHKLHAEPKDYKFIFARDLGQWILEQALNSSNSRL